jgi:hypothetical protein
MAHAHYFDFVIAGDGIGGLYAGLLLARAGARVAVLGQIGDLPPTEPQFGPVVRVRPLHGAPSLFYHLLEAGLAHEGTANLFVPRPPGFQLLGPELRLDITAAEDLKAELARERPDLERSAEALQGSLDRFGFELDAPLADTPLPARGFFESRAVKKGFGKLDRSLPRELLDSDIAPLLRGPALASGSATLSGDLGVAEMRAAARWRDADATLLGGRRALARHLAALCSRHNAKVELEARVRELDLKGWKVDAVIHSAGQPYGCGSLIVSRDADQLAALVTEDGKVRRGLDEYAAQAKPANVVAGVRLRLPPKALPSPLRDRAILAPKDPVAPGAGLIAIAVDTQKNGERLLCAAAAIPGDALPAPSALKAIAEATLDRLEDAIPFLRENLIGAAEPFAGLTYSFADPGDIGVEGLDPKTPLSNGWLVSRQILPGLGLEGELLAGRRIASWLHKGAVQPRTGAIARTLKRA